MSPSLPAQGPCSPCLPALPHPSPCCPHHSTGGVDVPVTATAHVWVCDAKNTTRPPFRRQFESLNATIGVPGSTVDFQTNLVASADQVRVHTGCVHPASPPLPGPHYVLHVHTLHRVHFLRALTSLASSPHIPAPSHSVYVPIVHVCASSIHTLLNHTHPPHPILCLFLLCMCVWCVCVRCMCVRCMCVRYMWRQAWRGVSSVLTRMANSGASTGSVIVLVQSQLPKSALLQLIPGRKGAQCATPCVPPVSLWNGLKRWRGWGSGTGDFTTCTTARVCSPPPQTHTHTHTHPTNLPHDSRFACDPRE